MASSNVSLKNVDGEYVSKSQRTFYYAFYFLIFSENLPYFAAACWVWQALWEERKRLQKRQKQKEENGHKWWKDASSAHNPIQFRLLDAVLFDGFSSTPVMGLFTSRQGELMRRTNTSLDLNVVRGRMAQLAMGVFGSSGSSVGTHGQSDDDHTNKAPSISVAHLSDGTTREIAGGADWDKFISYGVRNGSLKAITAWAAPIASPEKGMAKRMRHSYRIITEGSQFGKVYNTHTHKISKHVCFCAFANRIYY
jgi:hypothetical protein